ncbi:TIGR03752 family integrating conjugative element protein [Photobacterium sp. GB-72]|uniref:TIGR03752 family integrating conjugative element protein n=1 Tax=Photobacterium sp. GB-72 TaxID=2022105 RepID=UPI000D15DDD1|nr:TIGR03752 family integrating conjugative element protein [Photobacterium sp. GB-72]PSV28064.1 TIGR03752 family integrating conjugative element protein [Photobacterium sp. GB-72]
MSRLKTSRVVKIAFTSVIVLTLLFIIIFIKKTFFSEAPVTPEKIVETHTNEGTNNEVATVVVDKTAVEIGEALDTPEEKLRSMAARINLITEDNKNIRETLNATHQQNDLLREQIKLLKENKQTSELETHATKVAETASSVLTSAIDTAKNMPNEIRKATRQEPVYEDSYLDNGEQLPIGTPSLQPQLVDIDDYVKPIYTAPSESNDEWIQPIDVRIEKGRDGKKHYVYPKLTNDVSNEQENVNPSDVNGEVKPKPIPFGTINDGATLLRTRTMTAMIGRLPRKGKIVDAYKFKLKVSRENLASNYQTIPNLDGVIVQGTTSGDRVLKCVRGTVTKITFTFTDGRTTTHGGQDTQEEGLGYLSDAQGVPCISGKYISNDEQYVASNVLLDGFSAAAKAFGDSEKTRIISGDEVTEVVTGSSEKVALSEMFGAGSESGANIMKEFMSDSFSAIYVPNNTVVDVHIEQDIPIDYHPDGRKISYGDEFNAHFNSTMRL